MYKSNEAADRWALKFQVGSEINLGLVSDSLSKALGVEVAHVSESEIQTLWLRCFEPADLQYLDQRVEGLHIPIPLLFKTYADFATSLGQHLGMIANEHAFPDAWINASMPQVEAIFRAMLNISAEHMARFSRQVREGKGVAPTDVFLRSSSTQESLEQSSIRLHFENNGLASMGATKP